MAKKEYRGISEPRQELDKHAQENPKEDRNENWDGMFGEALDEEAERRFAKEESEQEEEVQEDYDSDDKAVEDMTIQEGFSILMTQKKMAILFTAVSAVLIILLILHAVGVLPKIVIRFVTLGFAVISIAAYLLVTGRGR